jgi:undecaprenyl-diphosphatase
LGVVLWWWAADLPRPSIIAALVVPVAVVVGYSRAFIGIHWLSEVLAGWLVATVAAAVVLAADRLVVPRLNLLPAARRGPVLAAGVVAVAVAVVVGTRGAPLSRPGPVNFSQGSLQESSTSRSSSRSSSRPWTRRRSSIRCRVTPRPCSVRAGRR